MIWMKHRPMHALCTTFVGFICTGFLGGEFLLTDLAFLAVLSIRVHPLLETLYMDKSRRAFACTGRYQFTRLL